MKVEWEISDKELIQLLIENYEFEAKSYIDAQLLVFFEKHKAEIEKTIADYINSKDFKGRLIEKTKEAVNSIASEELF